MAPPVSRIFDVCGDLLGAVVARHGGTLPDRQYVSAGTPAWDCELLATWCETTSGIDGDPGGEAAQSLRRHAAHAMRAGTFVVTLVRCTPAVPDVVGDEMVLTDVADEESAAQTLYEDAQAILNALVAEEKEGGLTSCNGLVFQGWSYLGPEGGLVAGELRVRIGLATGL